MNRLSALRRAAVREWGPLFTAVRQRLAERGARALALTLTAVALTAVVQVTQNQAWGYEPVRNLGAVRAEDPIPLALLRTPLSLFVPALHLPVWGALAQILLVFGVAEVCLVVAHARGGVRGDAGRDAVRPRRRGPRAGVVAGAARLDAQAGGRPRRRSSGSRCTSATSGAPGSPGRWWSSRWWWRSW
ncbi:hypothetical protein SBADM41S_04979 [Streptomyces badius]